MKCYASILESMWPCEWAHCVCEMCVFMYTSLPFPNGLVLSVPAVSKDFLAEGLLRFFVLMGHGCTICLILVQKRRKKTQRKNNTKTQYHSIRRLTVFWIHSLYATTGPSALRQPVIIYYSSHYVIANLMTSP